MQHEWKDIDENGNETHWTAEDGVLLVGGAQILEGGGPAAREILRLKSHNAYHIDACHTEFKRRMDMEHLFARESRSLLEKEALATAGLETCKRVVLLMNEESLGLRRFMCEVAAQLRRDPSPNRIAWMCGLLEMKGRNTVETKDYETAVQDSPPGEQP